LERFLFENPVIAISIYFISTIADYYLTIFGARYYKSIKQKIIYETGYELNPKYQSDVNKLSLWSPTFVRTQAIVLTLLIGAFLVSTEYYLVMFVYGLFLIPTLHVDVRHLSGIWFYRYQNSIRRKGLLGKIKIKSWLTYRQAAYHSFFEGALLFLIVFILTGSPIFLGGAVGELYGTRWFTRLSNNALKTKKELSREAAQKKREKPKRPSAANLLMFSILGFVFFQVWRILMAIWAPLVVSQQTTITLQVIVVGGGLFTIVAGLWLIRALGTGSSSSPKASRWLIPIFAGFIWIDAFTMPWTVYDYCLSPALIITIITVILGYIAFEGPVAKEYFKIK
jgi:hypothetical protein